jgi:hypothetical protein
MNRSRRIAGLLLFFGTALTLGLVFREYVVLGVVLPVATVLMLVWRILLSIHQLVYWGAVIALAVALVFRRFTAIVLRAEIPAEATPDPYPRMVDYWRLPLKLADGEDAASASLKRELRHMLVGMYAARQPEVPQYAVYDLLQSRQLPLPEPLYAFLFAGEGAPSDASWRAQLRQLAAGPGQWFRRVTGRTRAAFNRSVEDTLAYMEATMEIKHGDDPFDPTDH